MRIYFNVKEENGITYISEIFDKETISDFYADLPLKECIMYNKKPKSWNYYYYKGIDLDDTTIYADEGKTKFDPHIHSYKSIRLKFVEYIKGTLNKTTYIK